MTDHPSRQMYTEMRRIIDSSYIKVVSRYIRNIKGQEACSKEKCRVDEDLNVCKGKSFCLFNGYYHESCLRMRGFESKKLGDYCPSCENERLNEREILKKIQKVINLTKSDDTYHDLEDALLTAEILVPLFF